MKAYTIYPAAVDGEKQAPPSKSYTHRALVAGFLTGRNYRVVHPLDSDDTRATAQGLVDLGAEIHMGRGSWRMQPPSANRPRRTPLRIQCHQSGTTLRFLSAVASLAKTPTILEGDDRLSRRPMNPLYRVLRRAGVSVHLQNYPRALPVQIRGPLTPVDATLDTSLSSQFLSALLFVLPTLSGPSTLLLRGRPVSEDYVLATARVLQAHQVLLDLGRTRVLVPGGQQYRGRTFPVPGDASSAAYLWAAAAVTGGRVRVRGVTRGWPQADTLILQILQRMGARVTQFSDGARVEGGPLRGVSVDLTGAPDLFPLVSVLAAVARGRSRLRGAAHAIHKESNRRWAGRRLARFFGASVRSSSLGLDIEGSRPLRPIRLMDIEDHRVAMSAAVGALTASRPSVIANVDCVSKSYPAFWSDLTDLGARFGERP